MFFPVDSVNNGRTGICLRKIAYIVLAVVAVAVVIFLISYNAFAGQPEDVDSADSSLQVVEEVDLGDQGVFPADHILATVHVDGSTYTIDTDGLSDEELSTAYGFTLANQDYTEKLENGGIGVARGWNLQYMTEIGEHWSGSIGWAHLFQHLESKEGKPDNYEKGYYPKDLATFSILYNNAKQMQRREMYILFKMWFRDK